ncbi:MAG: hypothetical protein WA003_16360 [Desulfuromonadaceae bacterium]
MKVTCIISKTVLSFCVLVLAFAALMTPFPAEAHAPGVSLSGHGTATIDGVATPSEWASAGCLPITVNVPGGTTPGNVCAMNDDNNLYLLVVFARSIEDPGNTASFEFDNDHSGDSQIVGNDILLINPTDGFFDEVRTTVPPCPSGSICGFYDTSVGGTNDGSGAFANDGSGAFANDGIFTMYEFSHPLNSADDANDFSLSSGDTVGFTLSIRLMPASGEILADTVFPTGNFGDIVITAPSIFINIKPGSFPNSINPRNRGKIPVAILSTPTFNAPATINPTSPTFGRTGNEQSLAFCNSSPQDVNGDGIPDMVCHFNTEGTGFLPADTIGTLKAQKFNNQVVIGTDSVRILP